MTETKTGLVVVASQYESGGQRARELTDSAKEALEKKNIRVITGSKVIWDGADAIDVCKELKEEEVDSLTIVLSTWVTDSLLYILVQEMQLPVVFWAVPYTETFSIGCVQHFGSALTTHGIPMTMFTAWQIRRPLWKSGKDCRSRTNSEISEKYEVGFSGTPTDLACGRSSGYHQ